MKKYTRPEVIEAILKMVKVHGLRELAGIVGVDPGYLCKALNGHKPLSDNAALKLGFERMETMYKVHKPAK